MYLLGLQKDTSSDKHIRGTGGLSTGGSCGGPGGGPGRGPGRAVVESFPLLFFCSDPVFTTARVAKDWMPYQPKAPLFSLCCLFSLKNEALSDPNNIGEMFVTVRSLSFVGN